MTQARSLRPLESGSGPRHRAPFYSPALAGGAGAVNLTSPRSAEEGRIRAGLYEPLSPRRLSLDMKNWSRTDVMALLSLLVAAISCVAALLVVPEVRAFLRLTFKSDEERPLTRESDAVEAAPVEVQARSGTGIVTDFAPESKIESELHPLQSESTLAQAKEETTEPSDAAPKHSLEAARTGPGVPSGDDRDVSSMVDIPCTPEDASVTTESYRLSVEKIEKRNDTIYVDVAVQSIGVNQLAFSAGSWLLWDEKGSLYSRRSRPPFRRWLRRTFGEARTEEDLPHPDNADIELSPGIPFTYHHSFYADAEADPECFTLVVKETKPSQRYLRLTGLKLGVAGQ